ncbi:hypothetical protein DH2020_037018 [Rehmannia glutinosa]|uniref:C2H2-type domain-containing protein n=1 Tax=Rehmannia glutinosa TaxID=99300 RepID=A0ABR0V283_REHGL
MDCKSGDDDDDDDDDDQDCNGFQNDENVNYELRENPKKSWRIYSDPKHGLSISKNIASCKECGKEFSSLRALSGHMRSHSIKNKKAHQCKKCGKGFDSMRAMFGHMKSHSKRLRASNESAESLSELENLCPVRKNGPRLVEMEEVAKSLIMLSRGVRDWSKIDSVITESSDDDSVYFGGESSCRIRKFYGNNGGFVCDVDKKLNVCEYVGVDSKIVELEKLNDFAVKLDCANDLDKDFLVDNGMNEDSTEYAKSNTCNKVSSSVQESGFEQNSSENEANLVEILKGSEENRSLSTKSFVLTARFPSGQALGGHKRAHYNNESKSQEEVMAVNQEAAAVEVSDLFDLNFPVTVDEGIKRDVGLNLWWTETSLEHEALVLTN